MSPTFKIVIAAALLFAGVVTVPAEAADVLSTPAPPEGIEALIFLLRDKGVISGEEADTFIDRYAGKTAHRAAGGNVITIIPEETEQKIAEKVSREMSERFRRDLETVREDSSRADGELRRQTRLAERRQEALSQRVIEEIEPRLNNAAWAQRVRWGGDIRLRGRLDNFGAGNADFLKPDDPTELMNTHEDRTSGQYRLRLKVRADIVDSRDVNVGKAHIAARLATGNEDGPVSTNDTFGDYLNKDNIVLDQAYLKYAFSPTDTVLGGRIPEFSLTGGRIPNPWFSTDLLWDGDLAFEGLALRFRSDTLMTSRWNAFLTLGTFPLQEEEWTEKDKWLHGGQLGLTYDPPALGLHFKGAAAYYAYTHVVGEINDPLRPGLTDWTAPEFQQKGNTLVDIDPSSGIQTALASDFKILNLTGSLDWDYWFPIHVVLTADYVNNLGFDRGDVADLTDNEEVEKENEGYLLGALVGYPTISNFGEWNVSLKYKYLEADAVLDAFTDSDFHLGGTNAKGWILGGELGLYRDIWLSTRFITADEIEGPPLSVDTLQVDLNARF